ncbi:type VI secretion system-associated FHA domain protein TagH [Pseudomonas sp. SWRI154]|uniref:type VI secretion system-associated FHA domain protein TagH n=1 Tax=Pseudomonas sp. SWRI154 TaxID=2745501 RepID=UPI0016446500|nr:type VI secretion system-associated FHA domain protein TagH [Pseudomonas sp. SWRI154]MBC3363630.1 type VI secretion system-associated FHA domain protein TagH [Pseudomonas sp. SWRI154]
MEIVFELLKVKQFIPPDLCRQTFGPAGGVIGRGEDCDWVIPDSERLLSKRHAQVSFREGMFFLTDTSGNGISNRENGVRLPRGEPIRIKDGDVYIMGRFELRARLVVDMTIGAGTNSPEPAGQHIPDDAFLDLDPLRALDQQESVFSEIDELIDPFAMPLHALGRSDRARVDTENLLLPELVEAVAEPAPFPLSDTAKPIDEEFWQRFGMSLDMDLSGLDEQDRKALAINVALLFKQSVKGLQQSLRTRSDLKCELHLAQTPIQGNQRNPLKYRDDALETLLQPSTAGKSTASEVITCAFRDLQAHQLALLSASRVTLRATLEHFSPRQIVLRMEREKRWLLNTAGRYWRAYSRHHQALCQDDDWTERLLARDFAKAYEEQVRLISALQHDPHG